MSWSTVAGSVLLLALVGGAGVAVAQPTGAALTPRELLESVDRALPLLEQARQEVRRAEGEAVEARGAFDLTLTADAETVRGFYDNDRFTGQLEQPLGVLGLSTYGGYRLGRGVFAPYDGKAQTLTEGEVSAGFGVPLLRGRAIDARRAGRTRAELGVVVAEQSAERARLSYYKDALGEYWEWVAAGEQRRIAQALFEIAEARDQQLADAAALGQVAPVERTDNRRAILQRRSAVAAAQRELERQAIDLSLFLRGLDGTPVRPPADRLPELPRPADEGEPDEAAEIAAALARRPELLATRLERQQQEVALREAENGLLPALNLFSEAARDFGAGPGSRAGSSFEAGLSFEVPVQRRRASGKSLQARARLAATDQKLRWAEDRVRADVQDALSALRAARAVVDAVAQEVRVARELEALERDRFALGDSTQFLVNLRELATADAALREARALADYQKALVSVESATGRILERAP